MRASPWTPDPGLSILAPTGISTYYGRKILQPKRAYKICAAAEWAAAERAGVYAGAPVDRADGFIHLSTAAQVGETLRRHFAGRAGLVLVAIDLAALGAAVKWEVSRGGALFPHVYGALPATAAREMLTIPDDEAARQTFAADLEARA